MQELRAEDVRVAAETSFTLMLAGWLAIIYVAV